MEREEPIIIEPTQPNGEGFPNLWGKGKDLELNRLIEDAYSLARILEQQTGADLEPEDPKFEDKIEARARCSRLGDYVVKGARMRDKKAPIYFSTPRPNSLPIPPRRSPDLVDVFQQTVQATSTAVAAICAAGGAKALLELLKVWVDERKGRKIKIKKGDIEIEIAGNVSERQLNEAVKLINDKPSSRRLIEPQQPAELESRTAPPNK